MKGTMDGELMGTKDGYEGDAFFSIICLLVGLNGKCTEAYRCRQRLEKKAYRKRIELNAGDAGMRGCGRMRGP